MYAIPRHRGRMLNRYVGLGNILSSVTAFYGVRAFTADYAIRRGPAFDLRRASDNATLTVEFLPNGSLNRGRVANWVRSSSALIVQAYDQTGNGNHITQSTAGNQPTLILSATPNGRPCMRFGGSPFRLSSTTTISISQPWMLSAVAKRTSGTSNSWIASRASVWAAGMSSANNSALFAGSLATASATDAAYHSLQYNANGASSNIYVDGAATGVSPGVVGVSNPFSVGADTTPASFLTGDICELLLISGNPGNVLTANQRQYYGI